MTIVARSSRAAIARAHGESNFILRGIRLGQNHQSQVALAEWRHGKLNAHAALVVARAGVAGRFEGAFNRGFHPRARLRLTVRSAHDFHVERHVSAGKPRIRIEELHLNSATADRQLPGGRDFRGKCAGAQILNYGPVLLVNSFVQRILIEIRRSGEFLVTGGLPVQDPPMLVDHGIYEGMAQASVLGLHVKDLVVNTNVRIKS
jgi:hypothetical protein